MRRSSYLSIIGVTAVLGGVGAPALAADCATAQFSQAVLDRFPNIRAVCSEVITKDGQEYAVVKGDLVRTGTNAVYMKFKLADGTKSDTRKIETRPEFRVQIDGKPTSVRNLAVGQELTAYVKVTEPVMALAPADVSEPLASYPIEEAGPAMAASTAEMPMTASPMPAVAGLGGLLLAFAGMLTFLRIRRAS
ncbi:MAG TPA: hypothetical protein VFS58_01515 [Steroidobacteraceae bacterium]|nr:hypothetical protein [Steroidobacteraceae bacterium]